MVSSQIWCLVRYLFPVDQNPKRIAKANKDFAKKLDSRDIHKIEKKNSISISVFGYENKAKHPIYVSKQCYEEKHVNVLLVGVEGKRHYVLTKDFNTFMYDHMLHHGRKHFCCYCL